MSSSVFTPWNRNKSGLLAILLVFIAFTAGFILSPVATGDDWETFYGTARRALTGVELYKSPVTFAYYSNPPWVAVTLIPFSLLPFRWGWALVCTLSFLGVLAVSFRWKLSPVKVVLAMLSPAMLYITLHGQIDMLLLCGLFLPREWWGLLALAKPQVAIGLLFGIPPQRWLRAGLITAGVLLITLVLFGNWPVDYLHQPHPFASEAHNLWLGLWPFQAPVGVALILMGVSRSEEKMLVAGSPFLMPYATTSSLIGPWLAASAYLKDWQAVIVWLSWWGAVIYRGVGGG
jgi:hypothetical protein